LLARSWLDVELAFFKFHFLKGDLVFQTGRVQLNQQVSGLDCLAKADMLCPSGVPPDSNVSDS
jgi:hypothetical protein